MPSPITVDGKDDIHDKLLVRGLSSIAKKHSLKRLKTLVISQSAESVIKANPYHDELGRFTTANNSTFISIGPDFESSLSVARANSEGGSASVGKSGWSQTTPQAKWHNKSFAESPKYVKDAVTKTDGKLNGVVTDLPGSAHFNPNTNTISMPVDQYAPGFTADNGVWRHEYGHFFDAATAKEGDNYRSGAKDYRNAIKKDTSLVRDGSGKAVKGSEAAKAFTDRRARLETEVNSFREGSAESRQSTITRKSRDLGLTSDDVYAFLQKETTHVDRGSLDTDTRALLLLEGIKHRDTGLMTAVIDSDNASTRHFNSTKGHMAQFSDIVGSATGNELLGDSASGFGGHSDAYYKQSNGLAQAEIFANTFSLVSTDNKVWNATLEGFYPETTTLTKDIIRNG